MTNPKEMQITITLTEEALGMEPADPKIHETYIASNAPDARQLEEEIEAMGMQAVVEKGKTVFPKTEDGTPYLWDYQIRGFFKDALGMLRRVPGSESSKVKNYKKVVDGLLFVKERKIPFDLQGGEIGDCQRPLRAQTMQGERTAIAHSETVPAGSTLTCTLLMLTDDCMPWVVECLNYGVLRGIAQWRNSGKGRFTWQQVGGDAQATAKRGRRKAS